MGDLLSPSRPSACSRQRRRLALAWFTNGKRRKGLFYARSTDEGKSFSDPESFGDAERPPSHPHLLAAAGGLYRAWKEFDGTATSVVAQVSRDGGKSWGAAHVLASTTQASDHPLLVENKGKAYLSWLTREEGYRLIALEGDHARAGDIAPFVPGSFAEIRKARAGKPVVVHFWSVTCPACVAELADWGKISRERRDVDLVIVNADQPNERARVELRLEKAGLREATHFAFADPFVDRLYFEVDRHWRGELPFTALISASGGMEMVTGPLDDPQITAWFESAGK